MSRFKKGDIVTGNSRNQYGVTNSKMTKGEVISIDNEEYMTVKVLEHENNDSVGQTFEGLHQSWFDYAYTNNKNIDPKTYSKYSKDILIKMLINNEDKFNEEYRNLRDRINKARDLIFHKSNYYKIEDRFGDLIEEEILREYDLQELNKILDGDDRNES